jgi:hypothetical protein
MKKAVEKLESALDALDSIHLDMPHRFDNLIQDDVHNSIKLAIAELKAPPRWETPEQRERRTGEKWPDNWAVYVKNITLMDEEGWYAWGYGLWKKTDKSNSKCRFAVVCANNDFGPPPDDWQPDGVDTP